MSAVTFSSRTDVEHVLSSSDFEPPPGRSTDGSVAGLRAAMARFSGEADHTHRRAAVELAVRLISDFPFALDAERRTLDVLASGERVETMADLAFVVPTATLANALLASSKHQDPLTLGSIRRDVLAVVEVVGRQLGSNDAADDAADRLRDRFHDHPAGPVAPISLLYQNHDATAALLGATIIANHRGWPRRCSLARTVRVAIRPTTVGGTAIAEGDAVLLDLESTELEFGAGPHQCPGQRVAEQIVLGVTTALERSQYGVVRSLVEFHDDGRPSRLPMEPVSTVLPYRGSPPTVD